MDTTEQPSGGDLDDLDFQPWAKRWYRSTDVDLVHELVRPDCFKTLLLENEKKEKVLRTRFQHATVENAALSQRFKKLQRQTGNIIEATNSDDGTIRLAIKKIMNTVRTSQPFCLDCGRPYQAFVEVALGDGLCVEGDAIASSDGGIPYAREASSEDVGYMSISLVIIEGDFDNILQWPFSHKVTFRLINQTGGRDIIKIFQPRSPDQKLAGAKCSIGTSRFASINELNRKGFVQEDTLILECYVNWN